MNEEKVVGYCWQAADEQTQKPGLSIDEQKQAIFEYCDEDKKLLQHYIENHDRKHKSFPELEKAIAHAKREGATLVIAQLQNLTRYPHFTDPLLAAKVKLHCIDQPLVNNQSLPAVVGNLRYLRERHSESIREGLDKTLSQLGNPHALQEITKVNKPKTESAVLFAMILAPIIAYYRIHGYSQRKMVEALNAEGYLAPEGGPWVLSQLQKVLERIDLNNLALDLCETLDEFNNKGYTPEQMAKGLKAMGIKPPNKDGWDERNLNKVIERLHTIRDLLAFNQFVLENYPVMLDYENAGLSYAEIADKLNTQGLAMPERIVWELEQDQAAGHEVNFGTWDAYSVEVTMRVAKRRKDDIESYIRPETLARSESLFKQFIGEGPMEE
jgi:hypothetical protein